MHDVRPMTMTDHVPTLEMCQRLRDEGFPQTTLNFWVEYAGDWKIWSGNPIHEKDRRERSCAAPILSELLDQLPDRRWLRLYIDNNRSYIRAWWD